MSCCLCIFSQVSKTWLVALIVIPTFALYAKFSVSALFVLLSTLFLLTKTKRKPNTVLNESPRAESDDFSPPQENAAQENSTATLISPVDSPSTDLADIDTKHRKKSTGDEENEPEPGPQDLYSESESLDLFSTTSSEDHSNSDVEWPYSITRSDESISDEESLIEIAIPSGRHFVCSPEKDIIMFNDLKCCKLSAEKDIYEMNEEDNLIEIDLYMGSIKCSEFGI